MDGDSLGQPETTGEKSSAEQKSAPASLAVPPQTSRALDFDTGIRHILAPAMVGAVLGGLWQWYVMPETGDLNLPNPIHGTFIISLLLSPLFYRVAIKNSDGHWWEYSLGLLCLGGAFSVIWLSGWGAMFCGGYGALLLWVWISTDWGRYELPPFRYGIWHAFGLDLGAFAGSIFVYGLV